MRRNSLRKHLALILVSCVSLLVAPHGYAITIDQLKYALDNKEALTLIDVRINAHYKKGRIYGAINIPASIVERKRLPRLGRVIVYGDGIDGGVTEKAVMHLNSKPGIYAEILDGGYSAWSAKQTVVGRQNGVGARNIKNISYKKLQQITQSGRPLILVDLRAAKEQESLLDHFPTAQVYDSVNVESGDIVVTRELLTGIPKNNDSVLILIDDGNGLSDKVADKLHAAGTKRLAILTGGEQTLRTRGASTVGTRTSGEPRD